MISAVGVVSIPFDLRCAYFLPSRSARVVVRVRLVLAVAFCADVKRAFGIVMACQIPRRIGTACT
jgi:hypothetical protein